jgi:2-succinyl-6-hydroxy-2,4-cyclohexadiene-1-carboxylate synthase
VTLESGVSLRVEDRGEGVGAPLLLLHGFTGSAEAWGDPLLRSLASRRRVIVPDLPGHGGSPVVPRGRLTLPALVEDLCSLLDRSGVARAVWVGYSMGGRVALGAGVLRPERVDRLVLESASPGLASKGERLERRALEEEWARSLEEEGLARFVERWMALPIFASQQDLPVRVRDREKARRLKGSREGWLRALRGLGTGRQPSFWDDLDDLDAPVLLLTGEWDEKFVALADQMAKRIPDVIRHTVGAAGHAVHLEAPDAWLEAVLAFIEGPPEPPRGRSSARPM